MRPWVAIFVFLTACTSAACADQLCLSARAKVAAGSIAHTNMFVSKPCTRLSAISAFYYDRPDHVVRLARDVASGETVAPFPSYNSPSIEPGDGLTLVVAVGAVRVARHVVALQEAHAGQRLFVRGSDGEILAARFEPGEP